MKRPVIRSTFAVVLLGTTLGCSNLTGPDNVQVRIGNDTPSSFSSVAVLFPEDDVDYGAVAAGGHSGYRTVSTAYPYARVDVRIGSTALRLQPRDYVGETPLEPGHYTYSLYFLDGHLQLRLKRDR